MARTAMGISTTQLSTWDGAAPPTPDEWRALFQMPFGFIHVEPATINGPAKEWGLRLHRLGRCRTRWDTSLRL